MTEVLTFLRDAPTLSPTLRRGSRRYIYCSIEARIMFTDASPALAMLDSTPPNYRRRRLESPLEFPALYSAHEVKAMPSRIITS